MTLKDHLKSYSVLLASKSPRRRELLSGMEIEFSLIEKDVDESVPKEISSAETAVYLSKKKSAAFSDEELLENYLLITADTVVVALGKVLNKPKDRSEAIKMLNMLSGNTHQVITGVCVRTKTKEESFSVVSEVTFDTLEQDEIMFYVDQYKPYDKAGSYGIQEWIGYIGIKNVNGSFYNIMGLPTHRLYQTLKLF
jgi:septum formation protein